jgi:hypothetical protein
MIACPRQWQRPEKNLLHGNSVTVLPKRVYECSIPEIRKMAVVKLSD